MKNQGDSLLQLSRGIAAHLSSLRPGNEELRLPLLQMVTSAIHATLKPGLAPVAHAYSALAVRAAQLGLAGSVHGIADDLLKVEAALPWVYHYAPRSPNDDLPERIAFAELIGPDGPLAAPACRIGFTLIAEHTSYPMHSHPAVELYLVVSGRARWQTACLDRMVPPGQLVLHRSNEPHAMRTFDEPLLALWGWTGEIDSPAVYM